MSDCGYCDPLFLCCFNYCHTQRMLRAFFHCGCYTQKRCFPTRIETDNPCHRRRTFRERACFVDNQRVHFFKTLKGFGIPD
ncbi:Uncharacterised protein [Enterobacter cloacae]|nr:Uncharacterised protein [Enterobacter cloacae]